MALPRHHMNISDTVFLITCSMFLCDSTSKTKSLFCCRNRQSSWMFCLAEVSTSELLGCTLNLIPSVTARFHYILKLWWKFSCSFLCYVSRCYLFYDNKPFCAMRCVPPYDPLLVTSAHACTSLTKLSIQQSLSVTWLDGQQKEVKLCQAFT